MSASWTTRSRSVSSSARDFPVGTSVTEDNLADYIAGLVVTNDVSARDVQLPQTQFYEAKSYPTFTPVGPALVLLDADELKRFGDLRLQLRVNGEVRQNMVVDGDMIYRPLQALQALTRFQRLDAGDLVMTGTPAGTALSAPPKPIEIIGNLLPPAVKWKAFFKRQANNAKYLRDGDVVELGVATDDGAIDLGVAAHSREVRVTLGIARVPVVIVGAGPTGVTAATLLAQYGVDCLVLDRWPDVYPQPRAVHLDDEIYRIVARLGIADEFAAISRPAHGLRLLDNTMRVLAEFQPRHRAQCQRLPAGQHVRPARVRGAAAQQPQALSPRHASRRHRGHPHHRPRATDAVRVAFTDRIDGREHAVEADYLLGCDGANSVVRAEIGSCMRDLKFEQRWLVVDVATDTRPRPVGRRAPGVRPRARGHLHADRRCPLPLGVSVVARRDRRGLREPGGLEPLIAPWTARAADDELELIRVTEYTFRAQIADKWRRGNVFLLGDAAHLTPPFIGQGMGAGLRDAMNLSWKLAASLQATFPETVLDTYEQERKPHTRALIRLALNVGRSMTSGGEFGNLIRRIVVPQMHHIPGLRDKVVDSQNPRHCAARRWSTGHEGSDR